MARPVKNYCDYFTHDRDMRNHRKVKALRNKFGITGYAIWVMLLEYLTGVDGNEFENSESELEIISGDFGVPAEDILSVINYCIKLEMMFEKNSFIHSESLDERLSVVYAKREVAKSISKKQLRTNGKFTNNNADTTVVSVTEMPQSKVEYSKVKESRVENIKDLSKKGFNTMPLESEVNELPGVYIQKSIEIVSFSLDKKISKDTVIGMWGIFKVQNLTGKKHYGNLEEIYGHFINWITKQKFNYSGAMKKQTTSYTDTPTDSSVYDNMK